MRCISLGDYFIDRHNISGFQVNFLKEFYSAPKVLISTTGFDFEPKITLGQKIIIQLNFQILKITQTGFIFEVSIENNIDIYLDDDNFN